MKLVDLGKMSWRDASVFQTEYLEKILTGEEPPAMFFVEHDPVLTLGANFHSENLLLSREELEAKGIDVQPTNRGGDVTYHGPGQLVIYPLFPLDLVNRDLHRWMRSLEETMIQTLASYGLAGYRFPSNTGCWINERKIAAIGVKVRRWVSMHGIALNCDNDLSAFDAIIPCGIADYVVTSLTQELGTPISIEDAKPRVARAFENVFSIKFDAH